MPQAPKTRRGATLLEVVLATLLLSLGTLLFISVYPTASKTSRMSGNHSQAISVVQHKVDQLRSIGYGRLNYADLRAAGVVDTTSNTSPYRFEQVDALSEQFPSPIATLTIEQATTDLLRVRVSLEWRGAPQKAMEGYHEVTALIAKE